MIFRFGSFALDSERRELSRSGRRVALERQVFDILLYLLENRHRVVTREDVLRAVWRGRVVSESTLSSRITAVRQARRQRRATAADPDRDARRLSICRRRHRVAAVRAFSVRERHQNTHQR